METQYQLNESKKRLEPVETLCQFCNKRHAQHMDRNYYVPVFKEKDRTTLVIYNSVKFSKILIGIPRCTHCFVIHQKYTYRSWVISLTAALALAIMGFFILGMWGIFVLIACFPLGIITPIFLKRCFIRNAGILNEKEVAHENAMVQEFVIGGWSLTQPSP